MWIIFTYLLAQLSIVLKIDATLIEERLFLRAQCKAKCLELFQRKEARETFLETWKQANLYRQDFNTCFEEHFDYCSNNCFLACDQVPAQCKLQCSPDNGIGCHIGCSLLEQIEHPRPGTCPVTNKRNASQGAGDPRCYDKCQSDNVCPNPLHKCCEDECGKVCVHPLFDDIVPALAPKLVPFIANSSSNLVDLDWSAVYSTHSSVTAPVVFILQTRICVCKHFDLTQVTGWQTLIMTHQFGAKLDAFEPGRMYQFRIAAVSPSGSRGFGEPSEPYPPQPTPPDVPSPPLNLTDASWRFYAMGTIDVLIKWAPPTKSDLAVTEYSIKWALDYGYLQPGGQSLEGLTHFTKTVPADQTQYVIKNLQPSSSYKVQVRALSHWFGHGPLESQPNTIYLSTKSVVPLFTTKGTPKSPKFEARLNTERTDHRVSSGCECHGDPLYPKPLVLQKMFYDNGELVGTFAFTPPVSGLTYVIEWGPQVCINPTPDNSMPTVQSLKFKGRKRMLFLNNLQFGCRYTIRIRPSASNTPADGTDRENYPTVHDCFCTPSCGDVEVNRGSPPMNCTLPEPGPPLPPTELKIHYLGGLSYRLSWGNPEGIAETPRTENGEALPTSTVNAQVTKYRVVWAPRVEEPVSKEMYNDATGLTPIMDIQKSDARILEKEHTWLDLTNLEENKIYIARVQSIGLGKQSQERESLPATLYFSTTSAKQNTEQIDAKKKSFGISRWRNNDFSLTWLTFILVLRATLNC